MPTYQYACTSHQCRNEFELVQSFSDPAVSECPRCGGPVRKVFSAVGVVFKGSGFYHNDSRGDRHGDSRNDRKHATSTSESGNGSSAAAAKTGESGSSGGTNGASTSASSTSSSSSSSSSAGKAAAPA